MRQDKSHLPPLGRLLLLVCVNTAVFAATLTAAAFDVDILDNLLLEAGAPLDWRPLSYMFAHTGLLHFLCNMGILTAFGAIACSLGLHRFLLPLYVAGGLAGAAAFWFAAPQGALLAGSSAAVLCLVIAPSYWAYDLRLNVLPNVSVTMGAAAALVTTIALALPLIFGETGAAAAHAAGIGAGLLIAAVFSMPARAILTHTRRSRQELIERRRRALRKASRSGYSALTKAEKESL
ncbi:MAG: rhomboid family intramembrane serine protease [Muribaculaceae bacterium]|nr:rhomboid family intramembrane serine protease [Muribaculaceae bacterium]